MMVNNSQKEFKGKLLVLSHSGEIGGAELALLDTLDALTDRLSIIPHVIVPRKGALCKELDSRKWSYTVIPYSVWAWPKLPKATEDLFRERTANMKAVVSIGKVMDKIKPVAVMTNTTIVPWAALAAATRAIPHMWYIHEYGDLDHGLIFEQGANKSLTDIGLLSDLVIANSVAIETRMSEFVPSEKLHTLYIPYDPQVVKRKASEISDILPFGDGDQLRLVMVGRVTSSKGQLEAVMAVKNLVDDNVAVRLCIVGAVGDEKYYEKIKAFVQKHQLENNVTLVNYVSNPYPLIASADVGITCSELEAYGRTTYEYALLGKPVIGSNTGGTPEIVKHKQTGFLYEKGNVDQLSRFLKEYTKQELINQHGIAAKKHALSMQGGKYGVASLVDAIDAILKGESSPQKMPYYTQGLVSFADTAIKFKDICEDNILTRVRELEYELGEERSRISQRVASRLYRKGKSMYRTIRRRK